MPEYDPKKLIKYSRFFVKTIKANQKLKPIFEERIHSTQYYLHSIKVHELEGPFLNTLQFLCDMLLNQPEQHNKVTQTRTASLLPDFQKVSPIKFIANEEFFTENEVLFDNSQESDILLKNVNLQSERLARLHKQISETMKTNKILLTNPLKGEHSRSRSEVVFDIKKIQ